MKFLFWGIVPFFFCLNLNAQTEEAAPEAPTPKAEKIRKLREALRGSSEPSGKPAPRHPPDRSQPPADMIQRAIGELKPSESSYSADVETSSAVVRTQIIEAKDPVAYTGLQLGLTAQPYSPAGSAPLVTLGERDLGSAGNTWMYGLEMRYTPWTSHLLGEHAVGLRVGASYARQQLAIYSATGVKLANTQLHSLHSYALLSQEWVLKRVPWLSLNLDLGASRFDMILTSESTLGEASEDVFLSLVRVGPSARLGDFAVNLSYERREPLTDSWARLAADGVMLGILYGIR